MAKKTFLSSGDPQMFMGGEVGTELKTSPSGGNLPSDTGQATLRTREPLRPGSPIIVILCPDEVISQLTHQRGTQFSSTSLAPLLCTTPSPSASACAQQEIRSLPFPKRHQPPSIKTRWKTHF